METNLADGILEQVLVQLEILARLVDAHVPALFERTAAQVRRRTQRRVRQIGELQNGKFK